MDNQTEGPSANDYIESVMRNTLFQHIQTMMQFTKTASLALQIPDTDIEILAGPRERIENYLRPTQHYGPTANVVEDVQELFRSAGFDVRPHAGQVAISGSIDAAGVLVDAILEYFTRAEGADHLASQSQAAQPTVKKWKERLGGVDCYGRPYDRDIDAANEEIAELRRVLTGQSQAAPVAKAVPEGFALVPIVPTPEMVEAFGGQLEGASGSFFEWERGGDEGYAAMLAAAPTPQEVSQPNPDGVQALRKLCEQLDGMKRTMFNRPGTGQNYSYLVHEDVDAYVEEARKFLTPTTSTVSATSSTSDAVLRLLNHIEEAIDDVNWEKIDSALWNAVTSQFATSSTSASAPAAADEVTYNPNHLLDGVLNKMELLNDAALARMLEVSQVVIAKIRSHREPVGISLLIRMHKVTNMSIRDLRDLMGDRRAKYRLSDAARTEAGA